MTTFNSVKIRCPFYVDEDSLRIRCEGVKGCKRVSVDFKTKIEKLKWQVMYCNTDYEKCKICQAIEKEYK